MRHLLQKKKNKREEELVKNAQQARKRYPEVYSLTKSRKIETSNTTTDKLTIEIFVTFFSRRKNIINNT